MRFGSNFRTLGLASALAILASSAAAQEVTLRANSGNVEVVGDLVSFDQVTYIVTTEFGELKVRADEFSCIGDGCPAPVLSQRNAAKEDTVTIAGSSAIGEGLMPILLAGYAANLNAAEDVVRPDGAVEAVSVFVGDDGFGDELGSYLVRSTRSSDAFANLLGLSADIGMASRRIAEGEAANLLKYGGGDMSDPTNEHIIAIDSLLVVTNPDNPVDTLTMDQLRDIYTGRITNWSEVGGANAPINVVNLGEGSGTRVVFEDRIFDGNVNGVPALATGAESNSAAADAVSEDSNAIAYVSSAFLRGTKPVTLISDCDIPMIPDAFSARTEEYSLGRFLYLYTRNDNTNPDVRSLVNYITSPDADESISKSGFIDLGVTRRAQVNDGRAQMLIDADYNQFERRYANEMLDEMRDHDRLSATFRFETGSNALTPRGELNLERLAEYLDDQPAGTEVKIVGFTDSVGQSTSNQALAERRAVSVLSSLRDVAGDRLDGIQLTTVGYGEIAAASCNTDDFGRGINRRVEVWIKS